MKKYLLISFLFLLVVTPVLVINPIKAQGQQRLIADNQTTIITVNDNKSRNNQRSTPTPTTDNQNKNQDNNSEVNNKIQENDQPDQLENKGLTKVFRQIKELFVNVQDTQPEIIIDNQNTKTEIDIKIKENKLLDQAIDESLIKVPDQVQKLFKTVHEKSEIKQDVHQIAEVQTKLQTEIKTDVVRLNSRKKITKFFIGSDKKTIDSIEQKIEQNKTTVQQLGELKLKTKDSDDLVQIQETIDSIESQNISLQNKISKESKITGIFGWILNIILNILTPQKSKQNL